jgi:hypothetical protein
MRLFTHLCFTIMRGMCGAESPTYRHRITRLCRSTQWRGVSLAPVPAVRVIPAVAAPMSVRISDVAPSSRVSARPVYTNSGDIPGAVWVRSVRKDRPS